VATWAEAGAFKDQALGVVYQYGVQSLPTSSLTGLAFNLSFAAAFQATLWSIPNDPWLWPNSQQANQQLSFNYQYAVQMLPTSSLAGSQPLNSFSYGFGRAPAWLLPGSSLAVSIPMSAAAIDADFISRWITNWKSDQPSGIIKGVLTEYPGGPAVPGAKVSLLNRDNNPYFRMDTVTDANGYYQFSGVPGGTAGLYTAIAFDPEGGVVNNAVVADRVAL
jgi:hypothetical protein